MEENNRCWQICLQRSLNNYLDQCESEPNDLHKMVIGEVEGLIINLALQRCGNNQSSAARLLGISRSTLRHKLQKP